METLIGIYSKGTKRKFLNKIGRPNKDPFMKYKEIDLFKELFANLKPMKCLEYGCGTSTPYYIDHLSPDAEWGSVEHHQGWFDKIKEQISRPNLSLYHVVVEGNNGVSLEEDEYAHFPKQFAPFDFILVDGINRENCADAAKEMLSDRGVVLVHDSNRQRYHKHVKQYKYWFILEDFRKQAGGIGLASDHVDVTQLVDIETHSKLWKKDTAIFNFFKFKFLIGKKAKPFRLQTS